MEDSVYHMAVLNGNIALKVDIISDGIMVRQVRLFLFSTNNAINVVEYIIVLSSFIPFISFLLSIYQCVIICGF